jgi:hypothetical protein
MTLSKVLFKPKMTPFNAEAQRRKDFLSFSLCLCASASSCFK